MARPAPRPPSWILARDLVGAVVLAGLLYAVFGVFNARFLHEFSATEVLLLEAGGVVLVAALVARAVTNATNAVLQGRGLVPRGHAVRLFLNLLLAAGTAFALSRLAGVSADSILLGAGFTGVVLGLASQTVLANVFAGILIVFADPFRPGDCVGIVAAQYGLLAPSYAHEAIVPYYAGVVEDVGLTYTVLRLDSGGLAKIPNGVVVQALIVLPRGAVVHRVRMTFPKTVPVAAVEAALADVATEFPSPFAGAPPPRLEVADLAPTTWDGVVVLWSDVREPGAVRDRVLRAVLARLGRAPAA